MRPQNTPRPGPRVLWQLEFFSDPFLDFGGDVFSFHCGQTFFDFHPQIRNARTKARWFARELRPTKMEFPVADLLRPPPERRRNSPAKFATMRFQLKDISSETFDRESSLTVPTKVSDGSRITR